VENKENFTVRMSPSLKKRAHTYASENNYESTSGLIRELLEHNIDPKFRREQLKKDLIELSRDPDIQYHFKIK
jgi:predicted DNA-binding protein